MQCRNGHPAAATCLRCLFEIAFVLARFGQVACIIVNENQSIMRPAMLLSISDGIADSVRSIIPEPAER